MKHYTAINVDGCALIAFDGRAVLRDIYWETSLSRGMHQTFPLLAIREEEDGLHLVFSRHPLTKLELVLRERGETLLFSVIAECAPFNNGFSSYFSDNRALVMHFAAADTPDGVCASTAVYERFWQCAVFEHDFSCLPPVTQSLLWHTGEHHRYLLPLTLPFCRSEISGNTVELSSGYSRQLKISGDFLALSEAESPYTAISAAFESSRAAGAIRVPLRRERRYPEKLKGFGWCTWNAFYTDLTSEKIYRKLEEFRQKGVPVSWIILDDGWQQHSAGRLTALEEDRSRFPEGLKACIARIKKEYGVKYVGVWHAFTGYWDGIEPGSPAAQALGESLLSTPGGILVPAPEEEKQFAFFDTWHGYLAAQGVDFVKVDNQSGLSDYYNELLPSPEGVAAAHRALDRSVEKHFGGCLINCMGMNMENILSRPTSSVDRNSRDYSPQSAAGFYDHLQNNVYASIFHDQIQICDFDMWWSRHENAAMSAVLRAVSGGPVYVSDPLGGTDPTYIQPILDDGGDIYRGDHAAYPTLDCLYEDVLAENRAIKIYNCCGNAFTVAAFCRAKLPVDGLLQEKEIPEMQGDYLAVEYGTNETRRFDRDHPLPFTVQFGETRLWNFYPIVNGMVEKGREDKYLGCATEKTRISVDETTLVGENG